MPPLFPSTQLEGTEGEQNSTSSAPVALVIDDQKCVRTTVRGMLRGLGFEVYVARDGVEGLQELKAREYSLVLSDYDMPGMNGYECARRFREWEAKEGQRHERQHIVCFTASLGDSESMARDGITAGMDEVISKPYSRDKIVSLLNRLY